MDEPLGRVGFIFHSDGSGFAMGASCFGRTMSCRAIALKPTTF
jgi:hypothetical protein